MAGISRRIQASALGGPFHDQCHALRRQASLLQMTMSIDRLEEWTVRDLTLFQPGPHRPQRAGLGVLAEGNPDLASFTLLISLTVPYKDLQAIVGLREVRDVEG